MLVERLLLASALVAAPPLAGAQANRLTEVVEALQICRTDLSDEQIEAALRRLNWEDASPRIGNESASSITGVAKYRRGGDTVSVFYKRSGYPRMCNFTFTRIADGDRSSIAGMFDRNLGSHQTGKRPDVMSWVKDGDVYALSSQESGTLNLVWLPEQKKAAN